MLNKKADQAKEREAKREQMVEEMNQIRGEITNLQSKLERNKVEERKEMINSLKTTLTVENLPSDITEKKVRDLFSKYPGIKEVYINDSTHVAVIEYETHSEAKSAQEGKIC